jgi:heterodisulfide reductase subunit A
MEPFYTKAREKGVIFIRYEDNPQVIKDQSNKLHVKVWDKILDRVLKFSADLIVLNTAIVRGDFNQELSQILKVPLDEAGFFLEAHPKLRPVDFASNGLFLCGLAHSPKLINESIQQAQAAAQRAATILCKDEIESEGIIAVVDKDKCVACLTCVRVCPYKIPFINQEGVAEIEPISCHGCGTCAGECPAKAIQLLNYKDNQLLTKTAALISSS